MRQLLIISIRRSDFPSATAVKVMAVLLSKHLYIMINGVVVRHCTSGPLYAFMTCAEPATLLSLRDTVPPSPVTLHGISCDGGYPASI